jgi:hypothetical protein
MTYIGVEMEDDFAKSSALAPMDVSGQIPVSAAILSGKSTWQPLDGWLNRSQGFSRRWGGKEYGSISSEYNSDFCVVHPSVMSD